ncbi:queuosine precursor transporter [Kaustia mangrovi]|uniref:Probable queuosine precursor transporter n=1 Tax=Kaustia mangrovi TaxID=2593653 RepID=A0A7S8C4G3_9HYPH|nr:queuosine precursor transporter [Kaustia mangrovi]QPC43202.1 queuosine precursor transporter [Kaustia mangrovi]
MPERSAGTVLSLALPVAAMALIVVASNVLVQFPFTPFGLEHWFTWGAFTYPAAFFVTDLTNRRFGPGRARNVVYAGFALAIVASGILATPRIAAASASAFLIAQLLDVFIFDRLRREAWWRAPLASSALGSLIDTAWFFAFAFAGTGLGTAVYSVGGLAVEAPVWVGWAVGDLGVKLAVALVLLAPFGLLRGLIPAREAVGEA